MSLIAPSNQPIVTETRAVCRELTALLLEENAGLGKFDVSQVESRLQHKKRLSLRLEQLMGEIKSPTAAWRSDNSQKAQVLHLAEEIKFFQEVARNNALMLEAAHQIRADLILTIRNSVEAEAPRAQLYTAGGYMNTVQPTTTHLVARDV